MNKPHSPPDKRQLIADGLVDGLDWVQIRARLVEMGVSPAAADYERKRAEKDPFALAAARLSRRLAKRDWLLQSLGRLAGQGESALATRERIDAAEFFADFYSRNRPLLLTRMVDDWPARDKWSLDYIDEQCGGSLVELQDGRAAAADYEVAKDRHRSRARLSDVIERILQGPSNDFYVTAYNGSGNDAAFAPLWSDVGTLPFLSDQFGGGRFLWLGPAGTLTPFHHDLTNNLLVQLVGRKRVRLIPSWELGQMANYLHCFSMLTPEQLDVSGTPAQIIVEIGPGDALFLPLGWWHHVEALQPSVSVSFTDFAAANDFVAGYPTDGRF